MFNFIPAYILYVIAIIFSALICMYSVRKILFITLSRKIYDLPDDTRKIHGAQIPSLGGIGIFIGYIIVSSFFWPGRPLHINFFLPSTVLLFFTGIYDDLMNMQPSKKLVAQLLASAITIYFADIRIFSLYGIAGVETLPYWLSFMITVFGCTLFINAFNFIDGIDGLACVLAILYSGMLGALFALIHFEGNALVAFSLAGATLGLLFFNFSPAKIYMGDTGSMMLGFTIFILSIVFVNVYTNSVQNHALPPSAKALTFIHSDRGAFLIIFSILFLPVYDALRVFVLRISKGRSPLHADRAHLHYYLLDAGLNHSQAVLCIVTINLLVVASALVLQDLNPLVTLMSLFALASVAMLIIYGLRQKARKKTTAASKPAVS